MISTGHSIGGNTPEIKHKFVKDYLPNKTKILFRKYQLAILIADIVLLNGSFIYFFQQADIGTTTYQTTIGSIVFSFFIINAAWLIAANYTNLYQVNEHSDSNEEIQKILFNSLSYLGSISFINHYLFQENFAIYLAHTAIIVFILASVILHIIIRSYYKNKLSDMRYMIIGGKASNIIFIQEKIAGIYGDKAECVGRFGNETIKGIAKLGSYKLIKEFIKEYPLDKVFYVDSLLGKQEAQDIISICRSQFIEFEIIPREINLLNNKIEIKSYNGLPAFSEPTEKLHRLRNRVIKRAFDIVFSLTVILFIFPWLLPLIALTIRLESKGPIFFTQERTGYWNEPFRFIKFRSMTLNTESDNKQATKNDSRITKTGAFLRKTSLDELPQFFNVLMGDMSIVGPRPHMLKHTDVYSELIETYMIRHEVKPGITGWAQVNGWRGPTDELYKMAKRVEFDVQYLENWTFWLDLKCIFYTVFNAMEGEENAF